jgi:quercetin dioxygenase-like cupin family protein
MITRRSALIAAGSLHAFAAVRAVQAQPIAQQGTAAMKITRSNTQASRSGSAEYFTGAVRVDAPFSGTAPARVGGATVTFEPGARTAWHTHPLGQTLLITAGCGWVQVAGEPREEVRPGDIVWFPPGIKHWHGATATIGMSHIAIAEALDGKVVDWLEKVTDAQYGT